MRIQKLLTFLLALLLCAPAYAITSGVTPGVTNDKGSSAGASSILTGGTGATTVGGAQKSLRTLGALKITGLGDSITALNSVYQPTGWGVTTGNILPDWTAGTVYGAFKFVKSNGLVYETVSGGTSGVTAPTGNGGSDGGVTWQVIQPQATKGSNYLMWAEAYSNGSLIWDMAQGTTGIFAGAIKAIITNGGQGYLPGDTVTLSGSATGTLSVSGGKVTGITITNPGTGNINVTSFNSAGGTGAKATIVANPSGTFGLPGGKTGDMVAMLPDLLASDADIVVVHGGINNVSAADSYANIIADLKTCYETIRASGRQVIVVPILPLGNVIAQSQMIVLDRVNRWIRAYARGEVWANPSGIRVAIADPTGFFTNGSLSTLNTAIGGAGGTSGTMLDDGLHPSQRGYMYMGYSVWQAAKQLFINGVPDYSSRVYTQTDGYDINLNPGGNMLEGMPWVTGQAVTLGSQVVSDTAPKKIYYCTQAGTTSTTPIGTGTNIVDGTARWNYRTAAGMSTFNSGTLGTQTAAAGIVYSGALASGYNIIRNNGSATGTVAQSIESPWSNGQTGQRQVTTFTLGSGTNNEQWVILFPNLFNSAWGLVAADLDTTPIVLEAEVELSSMANVNGVYIQLVGDKFFSQTGPNNSGAGKRIINSTGEMMSIPNNGKILFRTQPITVPSQNTFLSAKLWFNFDASGGAGSATLTAKINYVSIRKAYAN